MGTWLRRFEWHLLTWLIRRSAINGWNLHFEIAPGNERPLLTQLSTVQPQLFEAMGVERYAPHASNASLHIDTPKFLDLKCHKRLGAFHFHIGEGQERVLS